MFVRADHNDGGEPRVEGELVFDLRVIASLGPKGAKRLVSELVQNLCY